MGLKIKAGMAVGSLVLSWAFGFHFLSGVATYLDTTGNIMVDIADGIGLVSKGIEALENYLDPPAKIIEAADSTDNDVGSPTSVSLDHLVATPPAKATTATATTTSTTDQFAQQQHPVICKKGKCKRYDPSKDKVLQQKLIQAEREKILQMVRQQQQQDEDSATVLPRIIFTGGDDDDFDEDDLEERGFKIRRVKVSKSQKQTRSAATAGKVKPDTIAVESAPAQGDDAEKMSGNKDVENNKLDSHEIEVANDPELPVGWKFGMKRILRQSSGLCQRLHTLLLKVVTTIFPWNRRARRRLDESSSNVNDEEEEQG